MSEIILDPGLEQAFLLWMLQDRDLEFVPKAVYERIYDFLVQEVRIKDKNKIAKYQNKIMDGSFEEILIRLHPEILDDKVVII